MISGVVFAIHEEANWPNNVFLHSDIFFAIGSWKKRKKKVDSEG